MKTDCVVSAITMKKIRLITLAALVGAFMATTAWPQATTCWRIVNGPGYGILIEGDSNGVISDLYYSAQGSIASGHFTDCQCTGFDGHYHGQLFTENDPKPNACGWGCVIKVPCSAPEAADGLNNAIGFIGNTIDENLGFKLDEIFHLMEDAAANDQTGLVDALGDAFSHELHAYVRMNGLTSALTPSIRAMTEYVDSALDTLSAAPFVPVIPSGTVRIFYQIGSGPRGQLLDPGSKFTVRPGEMVHFQALTPPGVTNPIIQWNYMWNGAQQGELPDGVGTAFFRNGISIVSEKETSLKLNVQWKTGTGKAPRDSITVNWRSQF